MKIVEILTAINESSTLNWLDKIKLVEGYHNNSNLMESNSENKIKQFNSLLDLSIDPVVNKTYIVTSLMLLNDNLLQFETPIIGKFIGYNNGFEFIDNQDNKKTFPPKITKRLKSTTETFIFDSIEKYNKFRMILKLSWDVELPSFIHSELTENSDSKVTDTAQRMIDRYSGLSYTPYERAGDHAMGYDSGDPRYKYWVNVQDEIRRIEREDNIKEAKRKSRKYKTKSKSVYSGWWGGYYGDNSSGGDGGGSE